VDCHPEAIGKENLNLGDFVKKPELLRDFLSSLMVPAAA